MMKKFLIGWGMALLVLPVLSFAQKQDYAVNSNSDDVNNSTNSAVPEGMEVVKVGDLNWLVPKGAKINRNGPQITVEDTAQYMSRMFAEMDIRLKKVEDASQDMSGKIDAIDTRLERMEQKLEGLDKKK